MRSARPAQLLFLSGACSLSLLFSLAHVLAAEPGKDTSEPAAAPAAKSSRAERRAAAKAANQRVTRADLATAYLRMEQAYLANPPTGERNAEVNRAFDQATLAFFTGKNAEAVKQLSELGLSLGPQPATPADHGLLSLKVIVEPPVWRMTNSREPTVRVQSMYEAPLETALELPLVLRLVNSAGKPIVERPFQVKVGPGLEVNETIALELPAEQLTAGLYFLELATTAGKPLRAAQWNVIDGPSLDEQRAANEQRLAAIASPPAELTAALATCRARNALLSDQLSTANSAQFLADYAALARDVKAEVAALTEGKDPYHRRAGDYWRVLSVGGKEIPMRIYAPPSAASDKPAPLLVVLHGAGGDENMFLEAYGGGIIKQLADARGMLIASPTTNKFGGDPQHFDALLTSLASDYAVDRERIYVLGHSMGAGATAALARARPEAIAAACCIAGGGSFQSKTGLAPLLAIVAELDAVIPAAGLKSSAEKAAADGLPVELRLMPGFGHTLVVGTVLPQAVDWLLEHRLQSAAGGKAGN